MTEPQLANEVLPVGEGPYDPELKKAGQLSSPTWELELFLSGAFVFSSFQLPGLIEALFRRLEPHVTEVSSYVLFDGVLYAKAIAFALIFTFIIHLGARAYWVALLGLNSVFPRGIRWDDMKIGPISRTVFQGLVPDLTHVIERLDNFCSMVFAAGLLVVVMFVFSTLLVGTVALSAYGLAVLFTNGQNIMQFFLLIGVLYVGVPVVGALVDRKYGEKMDPASPGYRRMRRLLRFAFTLNILRFTGPMMWTLASNLGRRKATAAMMVCLLFLVSLAAVDRLANSGRLSVNGYDFLASSKSFSVNPAAYEDMHQDGESYFRLPTIQSDMIRDPYVKLFIPYMPRRDNIMIPRLCPAVKPLQKEGLKLGTSPALSDSLVSPVFDCLRRIHQVALDGVRLDSLQFSFFEHPKTGVKGFVAYISADGLSHGRHTISVTPMPNPDAAADGASNTKPTPNPPFVIPFWK